MYVPDINFPPPEDSALDDLRPFHKVRYLTLPHLNEENNVLAFVIQVCSHNIIRRQRTCTIQPSLEVKQSCCGVKHSASTVGPLRNLIQDCPLAALDILLKHVVCQETLRYALFSTLHDSQQYVDLHCGARTSTVAVSEGKGVSCCTLSCIDGRPNVERTGRPPHFSPDTRTSCSVQALISCHLDGAS